MVLGSSVAMLGAHFSYLLGRDVKRRGMGGLCEGHAARFSVVEHMLGT